MRLVKPKHPGTTAAHPQSPEPKQRWAKTATGPPPLQSDRPVPHSNLAPHQTGARRHSAQQAGVTPLPPTMVTQQLAPATAGQGGLVGETVGVGQAGPAPPCPPCPPTLRATAPPAIAATPTDASTIPKTRPFIQSLPHRLRQLQANPIHHASKQKAYPRQTAKNAAPPSEADAIRV